MVVLIGILGVGCGEGPKNLNDPRIVTVRTMTVGTSSDQTIAEYVGVIEEESSVSISFREPGTVDWLGAIEGQKVTRGQLLARLDTANLRSAYEAALATRHQAEDAMRRLQMLYDEKSLPEIKYVIHAKA